jgi:hypothetical protein
LTFALGLDTLYIERCEMQAQSGKEKRKVHRSPSYPAFDLKAAIEKTKLVYDSEKRSATTPDVIASHFGYSQANGPGGRAVSALRQFGLIEESSGKYRVSDTGYTLVHYDVDSAEWKAAASKAARNPVLFKELLEAYPNGLPSDATLKNELLRREFNPGVVAEVISVFRDTLALASGGDVAYNETVQEEPVQTHASAKPTFQPTGGGSRKPNQLATQVLAISIPRQLSVDIAVKGDELKREDLAKIKSQFNRWIEGLEEAFEE